MSKGKKSLVKVVYGRTLIVLAIVLIQLAVLFSIYVFLMEYVTYIVGASTVLSAIVLLYIINNRTNPMYKISWIIPVALMPIFGTLLYIFIHLQIETRLIAKKYDINQVQLSSWVNNYRRIGQTLKPKEPKDQKIIPNYKKEYEKAQDKIKEQELKIAILEDLLKKNNHR